MSRDDYGASTSIIILTVALVLAALVGVFVVLQHNAATRPATSAHGRPDLSSEQRAYVASLTFADLHMSAAANFLGDTITYLDGNVTNNGAKVVRRVDIELNFVDTLNQVVLRETAHPLAERLTPLPPGGNQAFRVTFEHMPVDWNQAPPAVKVVYLEF